VGGLGGSLQGPDSKVNLNYIFVRLSVTVSSHMRETPETLVKK